jgi:hypothetical protein
VPDRFVVTETRAFLAAGRRNSVPGRIFCGKTGRSIETFDLPTQPELKLIRMGSEDRKLDAR